MLKTFLDGDLQKTDSTETEEEASTETVVEKKEKEELNPVDFMKEAVYHESFQGLKVYD
jgi:hypothetical protein